MRAPRAGPVVLALLAAGGCSTVAGVAPGPAAVPEPSGGDVAAPVQELEGHPAEAVGAAGGPLGARVTGGPRLLHEDDPIVGSPWAAHPEMQQRIRFWLDYWQGRARPTFSRYLERSPAYQPVIEREVALRELPPSLAYLPLIESGYNPTAVSVVGATGFWQFMTGTALFLGLRVDGFVDERRDPVAATPVALEYLATLRRDFGSWFLALAAYNSGPGRVQRILSRYGNGAPPSDSVYVALLRRFPTETAHFVPKFLAAVEMARHPVRYGFAPPDPADSVRFATVDVPTETSLDVVSDLIGVPMDAVVRLNPHLRQQVTPLREPWSVRVPPGTWTEFSTRLAEIPERDRVTFIRHRVASGETPSHIARRYGVSVAALLEANPRVRPRRMRIGQELIVPRGSVRPRSVAGGAARVADGRSDEGAASTRAQPSSESSLAGAAPPSAGGVTHTVRRGESAWLIARRYGVSVAELLRWNELPEGSVLYPGDRLRVDGARVMVYRVQNGDTLSEIAEAHGVSTRDLARWNGLSERSVIRPGDEVRIPVAGR